MYDAATTTSQQPNKAKKQPFVIVAPVDVKLRQAGMMPINPVSPTVGPSANHFADASSVEMTWRRNAV